MYTHYKSLSISLYVHTWCNNDSEVFFIACVLPPNTHTFPDNAQHKWAIVRPQEFQTIYKMCLLLPTGLRVCVFPEATLGIPSSCRNHKLKHDYTSSSNALQDTRCANYDKNKHTH